MTDKAQKSQPKRAAEPFGGIPMMAGYSFSQYALLTEAATNSYCNLLSVVTSTGTAFVGTQAALLSEHAQQVAHSMCDTYVKMTSASEEILSAFGIKGTEAMATSLDICREVNVRAIKTVAELSPLRAVA